MADWDSVDWGRTGTMDTHWIFMALASLGRLGQRLQIHGYPSDIHGIGIPA